MRLVWFEIMFADLHIHIESFFCYKTSPRVIKYTFRQQNNLRHHTTKLHGALIESSNSFLDILQNLLPKCTIFFFYHPFQPFLTFMSSLDGIQNVY